MSRVVARFLEARQSSNDDSDTGEQVVELLKDPFSDQVSSILQNMDPLPSPSTLTILLYS